MKQHWQAWREVFRHMTPQLVVILAASMAFTAAGGIAWLSDGIAGAARHEQRISDPLALPEGYEPDLELGEVLAVAGKHAEGKLLGAVELSKHDGKIAYKARFTDGSQLLIDASDGSVGAAAKGDPHLVQKETLSYGYDPPVTIAEALTRARTELPGKSLHAVLVAPSTGVVAYTVRFHDNAQVRISAVTGDVLAIVGSHTASPATASLPASAQGNADPSGGSGSPAAEPGQPDLALLEAELQTPDQPTVQPPAPDTPPAHPPAGAGAMPARTDRSRVEAGNRYTSDSYREGYESEGDDDKDHKEKEESDKNKENKKHGRGGSGD